MYTVFVKCPHCKQDTEVTFDIVDCGSFEGYENECDQCDKEFTFEILTKTRNY